MEQQMGLIEEDRPGRAHSGSQVDDGAVKQLPGMGHETLTMCRGEVNPEVEEQASLSPTLSRDGDGAYSGESRS